MWCRYGCRKKTAEGRKRGDDPECMKDNKEIAALEGSGEHFAKKQAGAVKKRFGWRNDSLKRERHKRGPVAQPPALVAVPAVRPVGCPFVL